MRASELISIRPILEQAIEAINDSSERERQSQKISAEFDEEYKRLLALTKDDAPASKLADLSTKLQFRVPPSRPFYPWRHQVVRAANALAECGWTIEAGAIHEELNNLLKSEVEWAQPVARDNLRVEIQKAAGRIRDVLMCCVTESQASKSDDGIGLEFGYVPNVLPKVIEWAKDIGKSRMLECEPQLSNDQKAFLRTVKQRSKDNPEQYDAAVKHWENYLSRQSDSSAR